jgi:glycerol uptake facilitator-like aquaporin
VTVSLFAALIIIAPFTGGHVNPAVSFGFLIKNAIIPDEKSGKTSW